MEEFIEYDILKHLEEGLTNISRKGFGYYERQDLETLHEEMKRKNKDAKKYYQKFINEGQSSEHNRKICEEIEEIYKATDDSKLEFGELLKKYSMLRYDFLSAYEEIHNEEEKENLATDLSSEFQMIQFCKNVRIMEDLINKICNNNIDKSIVKGERHFDSMKYGFIWLFCQKKSTGDSSVYHNIDIRDKTRYLDFIKYQIKASSKTIKGGTQTSSEVDTIAFDIEKAFDNLHFSSRNPNDDTKLQQIDCFKDSVSELISSFFEVYSLLIEFRDNLFLEEEIRHWLIESKKIDPDDAEDKDCMPTQEMVALSAVALRMLTDRFVSFVKINDLNFGNSTFDHAWFNYSELSDSNYAGSDLENVRIENAIIKNCDLSTCNFSEADVSGTDFTGSNFNYSNLTGVNFIESILNKCQFQSAVFRDLNLDGYKSSAAGLFMNDRGRMKVSAAANKAYNDIWGRGEAEEKIKDFINKITELYDNCICPSVEKSIVAQNGLSLFNNIDDLFAVQSEKIFSTIQDYVVFHLSSVIPKVVIKEMAKLLEKEDETGRRRREEFHGRVRLSPAILINASIKGSQMSGIDLSHVNMKNATFEDSDLSSAKLFYSKAKTTSFIRANLNHLKSCESDFSLASFSYAVANKAEFIDCNLYGTNWNYAILINALFLNGSRELQAKLMDSSSGMHTTQYYLSSYLSIEDDRQKYVIDRFDYNSSFEDAYCEDEWQKNCSLGNSKFENSLLDNASFINISSDKSSFNKSSMKNILMGNCSFHLSDFIETDLRYAFLSFCSMGDSNLSKANATMAKIHYVEFSNANLSGINFTKATIKNCAFVSCNIDSMILHDAHFENCVFEDLKFIHLIGFHSVTYKNCVAINCKDSIHDRALTHNPELRWNNLIDE